MVLVVVVMRRAKTTSPQQPPPAPYLLSTTPPTQRLTSPTRAPSFAGRPPPEALLTTQRRHYAPHKTGFQRHTSSAATFYASVVRRVVPCVSSRGSQLSSDFFLETHSHNSNFSVCFSSAFSASFQIFSHSKSACAYPLPSQSSSCPFTNAALLHLKPNIYRRERNPSRWLSTSHVSATKLWTPCSPSREISACSREPCS
jgi:hypothetical protein